ncbi:MAG: phage integrase central domain-containing protein, partial [Gaiellaceae bacterium]
VGDVRTEGRADGLTKAQAEQVLRRMREIDVPRSAPGSERVTIKQAGAEFCQRLELKGRRKSHRLTVASDLRNHIAPFFAGKTIERIRPEDIERYVAAKRRTLAIKTVRNHVNTMHSIFDLGLRKGWCQSNPVKLADRPTLKKTERSTRTTSRATRRPTRLTGHWRESRARRTGQGSGSARKGSIQFR